MGGKAARARTKPGPAPYRLVALVEAWWNTILAGDADEPHPIHGERLAVRLNGGRLKLSGEVESKRDRDELVREARARIGRGISEVDAAQLKVAGSKERPGVLEQTLVAAFPNEETADLALEFVLERSRTVPARRAVLAPGSRARPERLVPAEFADDVRKRLDKGQAVLVLEIDETAVFRVRALLEQDTRSLWTVATPPRITA